MTNFKYFVGIDVSKNTVDYCFLQESTVLLTAKAANTLKGFEALEKHAKTCKFSLHESLFCIEHTGIYNHLLLRWLNDNNYQVCLQNPLAIKRSLGLQRGKNDRIDAERIANYAYRFKDKCTLWQPPRKVVEELQDLSSLRRRLLNAEGQLKKPLKEAKGLTPERYKMLEKTCASALEGLEVSLAKVNQQIDKLVKEDNHLARLFSLATSVHGVGAVTATQLIIVTNEFKKFDSCKKLACYAGVVPFEHSSGSSIRGKTRVSPLANKPLKMLLHMAAVSAIKNAEGELGKYYKKKVEEGKSKMSVLNAVRNKLLSRVFACIRDNRKYEEEYQYELKYAS